MSLPFLVRAMERRAVLFAALLSAVSWRGARTDEPPFQQPDCGEKSLFAELRLCGIDASLQRVTAELPPARERGHSMADVQAAAARLGLVLEGFRATKRDVSFRHPVIALIPGRGESPGHYLVMAPAGETGKVVQLIDPPLAPRVLDYEAFFQSFDSIPILSPADRWRARLLLLLVPGLLLGLAAFLVLKRAAPGRADRAANAFPRPG